MYRRVLRGMGDGGMGSEEKHVELLGRPKAAFYCNNTQSIRLCTLTQMKKKTQPFFFAAL